MTRLIRSTAVLALLTTPVLAQDQTASQPQDQPAQDQTAPQDTAGETRARPSSDAPGSAGRNRTGAASTARSPARNIRRSTRSTPRTSAIWNWPGACIPATSPTARATCPPTVWSATPIYANDMLYIGTPFYRVLALDPATGEEIWSFDSQVHARGADPARAQEPRRRLLGGGDSAEGEACQKIVYLGTMDARLFAIDADTGEPCEDFADGGVLDVNQWNTVNDRWPLSLLQPPTIVGDHVVIGWAGNDWDWAEAPPGSVFSVNAQTGELEWTFDTIPEDIRERTGTANVWTAMSADEERGIVYLPGSLALAELLGRQPDRGDPLRHLDHGARRRDGRGRLVAPMGASRHLGLRHQLRADADGHHRRRRGDPGADAGHQDGVPVRREPRDRRGCLADRGTPRARLAMSRASAMPRHSLSRPNPRRCSTSRSLPDVWWLADLASLRRVLGALGRDGLRGHVPAARPPRAPAPGPFPTARASCNGAAWRSTPKARWPSSISATSCSTSSFIRATQYDGINGEAGPGESGFHPQTGAPFGMSLQTAMNRWGMPCWEPPFGELAAIDMTTGEMLWRKPFGMSQRYGFYMPEKLGLAHDRRPGGHRGRADLHRCHDGRHGACL